MNRGGTSPTSRTLPAPFSESLTSLGIGEETTQAFEWLRAYPAAHPLLDAIETSFTSECVLTAKEAADYAQAKESCPPLPPADLTSASAPILDAPLVADVREAREKQLQSAQQRLTLLKNQRALLREATVQKRARSKPPVHAECRDGAALKTLLLRLRLKVHELNEVAQEERLSLYPNESIQSYVDRENAYIDEIVSFASQTIEEKSALSADGASTIRGDIQRALKSYAEIKSDHCRHEGRLVRTTAILTALNVSEGGYLETSKSSLHHLIKDLQAKSAKELQTKAKEVGELAYASLRDEIRLFALRDALKQQQSGMAIAKSCVSAYVNQRLRVLSFQIASTLQYELHDSLRNKLRSLSKASEASVVIMKEENRILEEERYNAFAGGIINALPSDKNKITSQTEIDSVEGEFFREAWCNSVTMLTSFMDSIGGKQEWLHLGSHPRFPVLVEELQELLKLNGSALDSLLREKSAILERLPESGGGPDRRWVHFLNSNP